jgi:uncharacterized phage-associated protein
MATVHDVAAYILAKQGPMSAMKLQKLAYYSQAWHLVWDDEPLFEEGIEAWANGPVVYELFDLHRGRFSVEDWPTGEISNLTESQRESIDAVLDTYGDLDGRKLSHLTHSEDPWIEARAGLPPTARSSNPITFSAMQEYYGSLDTAEEAVPVEDLDWDGWESPTASTV